MLIVWYLDDGIFCGSLESISVSYGLHLNQSKCLLHSPVITPLPYNPLPLEVPIVSGGFTLLGSPIGPSVFGEEFVLRKANKVVEIVAKLRDLEDSQMETTVLR